MKKNTDDYSYEFVVSRADQIARKNIRREEEAAKEAEQRKKIKLQESNRLAKKRYKDRRNRIISLIMAATLGAVGYASISDLANRINAKVDVEEAVKTVQEYEANKDFVSEALDDNEDKMAKLIESIDTYSALRKEKRSLEQEQEYYDACANIANFNAESLYGSIIENKLKQTFGKDVSVKFSYEFDYHDGTDIVAIRIIYPDGREEFFPSQKIERGLRNAIIDAETYNHDNDQEDRFEKKFEYIQKALKFSKDYNFKFEDGKIKKAKITEEVNQDEKAYNDLDDGER